MSYILNPYRFGSGTPPMIDTTSMTLWFKGYAGTLLAGVPTVDTATIDQWENQISTTDALQGTAAARPTWQDSVINGKGVVRFDGTDDFLSIAHGADTNITNPITMFFLFNPPTWGTGTFTMLLNKNDSAANSQYGVYVEAGPTWAGRLNATGTAGSLHTSSTNLTAATWNRIIIEYQTGPNETKLWENGIKINPSNSLLTNYAGTLAALIGSRVDGWFNAFDLLEMGMWNRNISDAEVSDLDLYMQGVLGLV